MLNRLHKDNKGFTIIEVLIVLAIAGLIMLIVFLAIPALQRNQRNNARNSEASRISTAVSECLANRNGQATSCDDAADIANLGITVVGTAPNTTLQGFQRVENITFNTLTAGALSVPASPSSTDYNTVNIDFGMKCGPDGATVATGTSREFTVTWLNEPRIARCIGSESN